jgi:hypothetical protein
VKKACGLGRRRSWEFEDFVRRSGALLRTAMLLTGQNRSQAEGLPQGALERACRRWGRIGRSGDPERYVRRLGRRGEHSLWPAGAGRPPAITRGGG